MFLMPPTMTASIHSQMLRTARGNTPATVRYAATGNIMAAACTAPSVVVVDGMLAVIYRCTLVVVVPITAVQTVRTIYTTIVGAIVVIIAGTMCRSVVTADVVTTVVGAIDGIYLTVLAGILIDLVASIVAFAGTSIEAVVEPQI